MGKGMVKNLATKMPGNLVIWNRSAFGSIFALNESQFASLCAFYTAI
jgi:hypothetical protein